MITGIVHTEMRIQNFVNSNVHILIS